MSSSPRGKNSSPRELDWRTPPESEMSASTRGSLHCEPLPQCRGLLPLLCFLLCSPRSPGRGLRCTGLRRTCTGMVTHLREVRPLAHAEVSKGPWSLLGPREMAMACASSVPLGLPACLQPLYRMMGPAGVIIPAPAEGRRGDICTGVF